MRWLIACSICWASFVVSDTVCANEPSAQAETTSVFRGARIYPVAGPVIEHGVLVVRKGKIVAVGPQNQVQIPEGAALHDLAGKTMIPGLVDSHSHIGIYPRPSVPANGDGNEMTGPAQPGLRALDAIFPDD